MYVHDVGLVQRLAEAVAVAVMVVEEEEEEEEVKSSPIEDSDEEGEEEDEGGKMTAGLTTAEGAAPIPCPCRVGVENEEV